MRVERRMWTLPGRKCRLGQLFNDSKSPPINRDALAVGATAATAPRCVRQTVRPKIRYQTRLHRPLSRTVDRRRRPRPNSPPNAQRLPRPARQAALASSRAGRSLLTTDCRQKRSVKSREICVEVQCFSRFVEIGLVKIENLRGVRSGKVSDDNIGNFFVDALSVFDRVAEALKQGQ